MAAHDRFGNLASFSNFGNRSVHLSAPGAIVHSTLPTGGYGAMSGTSMAAPHVTGAAALYKATWPKATAPQIRRAILSSVIPSARLAGKVSSGGALDMRAMLSVVPV